MAEIRYQYTVIRHRQVSQLRFKGKCCILICNLRSDVEPAHSGEHTRVENGIFAQQIHLP